MATWKKIITSGSNADLNQITASAVKFPNDSISGDVITGGTIGSTTITALAGNLSLGDNNITNVGSLAADSIVVDDAAQGLNITFGGNTTKNKITLTDNLADALNITEGSNSYIKFITSNSSEEMLFGEDATFEKNISGSVTSTGSFGHLRIGDVSVPDFKVLSGSISSRITAAEANDGDITSVVAGDGLKDGGNSGDVTLNIDVSDFAGDGLRDAGSENLAVDVSDFAGTGLEDDGSENLRLASQGTGIAGGGGSTLSVAAAQTSITSIINSSLGKIGTNASQEYIDFSTSNEVNIKVNNTERLSVTNAGVVVTGDLTVNGTTTTVDTTNTQLKDQFLLLASGSSATNVDAGLIVQSGSVPGTGSAFYHDQSDERWAVAKSIGSIATEATTPLQFVTTVKTDTVNPDTTSGSYGAGEMHVNTDTGEIWIRFG